MRILASLVMVVLVATAVAQEKTPKAQLAASADGVKELQKERIATLREAADISQKLSQIGRVEVREALEDRVALLKAELDAAEKESERAALHQQALDSFKSLEELARASVASGRGTQLEVLRVKARRLEVEMQLEQAKVNSAK